LETLIPGHPQTGNTVNEHESGEPVVISSLVVHTHNGQTEAVGESIRALDAAEIVKASGNKYAVVLETASTEDAAELTERIRATVGVTGIELVAHFFEDEVLDNESRRD